MFRVNIQKCDFLKAKFSLYCKNYNDALYYFIRASKRKSIVIDGLIKKKSLKHIYKLLLKMQKKFNKYQLKNLYMEKEIKDYQKNIKSYNKKIKNGRKITNKPEKIKNKNTVTFGGEIENIKNEILEDISECNAKQEKDILILIDFNIYNNQDDNFYTKTYKIDAFIEQVIIILKYYLSAYDRVAVLIYSKEYKIICPFINVNKIDINNFTKDLINYKDKTFNEKKEMDEYGINLNDSKENNFVFNLDENNLSEHSLEDSFEMSQKEENNYIKINGLVKAINYLNNYSKIKEGIKNEKYIIVFTDFLNMQFFDDAQMEKILDNLKEDKGVIFLLIGKNKKLNLKHEKHNWIENDKKVEEFILYNFGEKSEVIYFENMKKIKTILSNNNIIKEQIIFPNEVYK